MSDRRNLIGGTSLILISSIVANVLGVASRILLANGYPPAIFGRIMVGYSVYSLVGTISTWGLDTAMTHYLPQAKSRVTEYEYITTGLVIGGIISVFITSIVFLSKEWISQTVFRDPLLSPYIFFFALGIPMYVLLQLAVSIIRGYENTRLKVLSKDIIYNLLQTVLIGAFLLIGIAAEFVGTIYITSAALSFIVAGYFILTTWPPSEFLRVSYIKSSIHLRVREFLLYATPLVFITVATWGVGNIDRFLLQALASSTAVGIYSAIYPFAVSQMLVIGAFGYLYLPVVSDLQSSGRKSEIIDLYAFSTYLSFSMILPVFVILVTYPSDVIDIFYPSSYVVADTALQILATSYLLTVVFGLNTASLNAMDRTKSNSIFTGIALVINIFLNVVLIPTYRVTGAAAATLLSFLVWDILSTTWLFLTEGIHPFSDFYIKGATLSTISTFGIVLGTYSGVSQYSDLLFPFNMLYFALVVTVAIGVNILIVINTLPENLIDEERHLQQLSFLRIL